MVSIGLRVMGGSEIYYSIIDQTEHGNNYIDINYLNVPVALERPESLNFIRNTLMDIFEKYEVSVAVIRISEIIMVNLNNTAVERFYIEGVIQEAMAGSSIEKYKAARNPELTRLLKLRKTDYKDMADGGLLFTDIPENVNWKKLSKEQRESILAANAAFNL